MPSDKSDFEQLLEDLSSAAEAIKLSELYPFSDLTGSHLTEFREAWQVLPGEQRRRLAYALAELAEASFEVNFDAIFRFCLADPDPEVRAIAIDGLWENEDAGLIGPLLALLRNDSSPLVRSSAAEGLGRFVLAGELERIESPVQARIMTELLTTFHLAGENVEVRRRAMESAAYACTAEINQILDMAYYDDEEAMRISAVVGMGRSCDQRWAKFILDELESASAAMRYEAALASGELGLHQAVPALGELLDDADSQIRDAAIHALGQISGPEAKQVLLDAYAESDASTRGALEEALAEQALADGDVDFVLYEVDRDLADYEFDDEIFSLWSAGDDDDEEESDLDTWSLDDD
jgi:hypothetical protein